MRKSKNWLGNEAKQSYNFVRQNPTPYSFARKQIQQRAPQIRQQVQQRVVQPARQFTQRYPTPASYGYDKLYKPRQQQIQDITQPFAKRANQFASIARPIVDYTRHKAEATSLAKAPAVNIADFMMQVPQSIARSVVSTGVSALGKDKYTPKSEFAKLALKPYDVYRPGERGKRVLQGFGVNEETARKYGVPLGILATGADLIPGIPGKKQVAGEIGEQAVKQLAKTTTRQGVKKILPDIADDIAEQIAKSTDTNVIKQLTTKSKKLFGATDNLTKEAGKIDPKTLNTRHATEVYQELDVAEAGKRFNTGDGFIAQPSSFPEWIPKDLRKTPLLNKVKEAMANDTRPTGKAGELYDVVKREIQGRDPLAFLNKPNQPALNPQTADDLLNAPSKPPITPKVAPPKGIEAGGIKLPTKKIRVTGKGVQGTVPISHPTVALKLTKSGQAVPAIRRGSGVSAEKVFETHPFKDANIGKTDNILSAVTNADNVAESAMGTQGMGPLTKRYFDFSESVSKRIQWADLQKQQIAKALKNFSQDSRQTVAEILDGKNVGTSEEKAVATQLRTVFDDLINKANATRKAMGKEPIPYRKDYFSHMKKTGLWSDLLRDTKTQISEQLDFIIPNTKKNPFAEKRLADEMIGREKNPLKVFDRYIDAISNDIFTTPEIEKWKAVNEVLKGRGMTKTSGFIDRWIRENVVGKPAQLDISLGLDTKIAQKAMSNVTRARNLSVLGFNIPWSVTTQPASMVNTLARTMTSAKGALKWFNPATRAEIEKLPTMVRKTYKGVGTTLGGDVDRAAKSLYRSKLDKVNDVLAMLSNSIEKHVTGMSIAAGYDRAAAKGIKGKDATRFAQYIGETTQSMYDSISRPLSLNPKIARTLAPFQTFSHEMFRYAKTLAGKGGGIPLDARTRIGQATALITGMYLYSEYVAKPVVGRSIGSVGTFIPFAGSYVDEKITDLKRMGKEAVGIEDKSTFGTGAGRAPVAPLEDIDKIMKAVDAYIKYKNINPLRKELINWGTGFAGVAGGVQINRFIDGLIASETGYQPTKSGNVAFPVEGGLEKAKSMILGPYGTTAGKEYIEKGFPYLSEKQSELFKLGAKSYEDIMGAREANTAAKKELEAIKSGKKTDAQDLGEGIYQLSNGKFYVKELNKSFDNESKVKQYVFEKQFGDYDIARDKYTMEYTQAKRVGDMEAYSKTAQTYLDYLYQYKGIVTDEKEQIKVQKKINEVEFYLNKYVGQGGFKKGSSGGGGKAKKPKALPKVSQYSGPAVQRTTATPKISFGRKAPRVSLKGATYKSPKQTASYLRRI